MQHGGGVKGGGGEGLGRGGGGVSSIITQLGDWSASIAAQAMRIV